MAIPPNYPPYQQPLLDAQTRRVTTVWHRFFLSLVSALNLAEAVAPGLPPLTAAAISAVGYWTPITDGVTPIPELLFDANADCVIGFVPTP